MNESSKIPNFQDLGVYFAEFHLSGTTQDVWLA